MGAPFGNKNAAGRRGGKKSIFTQSSSKTIKYKPGKIHYDSPKFQAAARRQKRAGIKSAFTI